MEIAQDLLNISHMLSLSSLLCTFRHNLHPLAPPASQNFLSKMKENLEKTDEAPPKRRHYLGLSRCHVTRPILRLTTVVCRTGALRTRTAQSHSPSARHCGLLTVGSNRFYVGTEPAPFIGLPG